MGIRDDKAALGHGKEHSCRAEEGRWEWPSSRYVRVGTLERDVLGWPLPLANKTDSSSACWVVWHTDLSSTHKLMASSAHHPPMHSPSHIWTKANPNALPMPYNRALFHGPQLTKGLLFLWFKKWWWRHKDRILCFC